MSAVRSYQLGSEKQASVEEKSREEVARVPQRKVNRSGQVHYFVSLRH